MEQDENNQKKQNNTILIIITIIVVLAITLFLGYQLFFKELKTTNNKNNNKNTNVVDKENNKNDTNSNNKDNNNSNNNTNPSNKDNNNNSNNNSNAVTTVNMNETMNVKLLNENFDIIVKEVKENQKMVSPIDQETTIYVKVKVQITNNNSNELTWLPYFALVDSNDKVLEYPDTFAEIYETNDSLELSIPAKSTKEGYLYFPIDNSNFTKFKITDFVTSSNSNAYYINLK